MKREALGHTKMKRLCDSLDLPLWQAVGILETLWHLTAHQAFLGDIGRLSNRDICLGLGYRADPLALVDALVDSGWLDHSEKHRLIVHDWSDHSDKAIQKRVARNHKLFADGRMPRLTELSPEERKRHEPFYQGLTVTTHGPHGGNAGVTRGPQTDILPFACNEAGVTRGERGGVVSPLPEPEPEPEPEPNTYSAAVVKLREAPPPNGNGHAKWSALQLEMREWLLAYPGASKIQNSPDVEIVNRCLSVAKGDYGALGDAMKRMAAARKAPSSSWAWFPKVLQSYLGGAA